MRAAVQSTLIRPLHSESKARIQHEPTGQVRRKHSPRDVLTRELVIIGTLQAIKLTYHQNLI